jgi:RimJ/RimL family protein N-acetyltransferase
MRLENIYMAADNSEIIAEGVQYRDTVPDPMAVHILYELLEERKPHQNISHKELPDYEDHENFVASDPYKAWFLIEVPILSSQSFIQPEGAHEVIGTIYLTHQNEIGIQLFEQYIGQGYGEEAVKLLMDAFEGPFYANINPNNQGSIRFFEKMGFQHIQQTYKLEAANENITIDIDTLRKLNS